jgi:glucosamine-6-phosphate deaminase
MHFIEKRFSLYAEERYNPEKIDTIIVSNYMDLGRMTALRFIHWAMEHPEGTVSLPTGKTPQFFIEWVMHYKRNWSHCREELIQTGFSVEEVERGFSCASLQFIQIDEFFPIKPSQANSFLHYIETFYINGFGFDPGRALLIQPEKDLKEDFSRIFPDGTVDYSLQYADQTSLSPLQREQKKFILRINQYADEYEQKIRKRGGIQFFLGGIGPDGHIGFNVRGSSHFSTTRLSPVNYETMAASAGDLGGIQKDKQVITIGLKTITERDDAVIIIMAAGNAKAKIVRDAIELKTDALRPASCLHQSPASVFYLTPGAASLLKARNLMILDKTATLPFTMIHQTLCEIALKNRKSLRELNLDILRTHEKGVILILKLGLNVQKDLEPHIQRSLDRLIHALEQGNKQPESQTTLHTAPHHDDLILGIFPDVIQEIKSPTCHPRITVLTSGFTAVTNTMFLNLLKKTIYFLEHPDLDFDTFCQQSREHDCRDFIEGTALMNQTRQMRARIMRFLRDIQHQEVSHNWEELHEYVQSLLTYVETCYPGQKDPVNIQTLKGALREFEEELLWLSHGMQLTDISHERLGFYKGDIFNQDPEEQDVEDVLKLLLDIEPNRISLALDPEGSGPDTHYKVLLAVSRAVSRYRQIHPGKPLSILGYRNVWNRFQIWEADVMHPLTLPELQEIDRDFKAFNFSQVNAPFPSPDNNGPFSEYSQKIWVEQKQETALLLGEGTGSSTLSPDTQAMIYARLLTPEELIAFAEERSISTKDRRQ